MDNNRELRRTLWKQNQAKWKVSVNLSVQPCIMRTVQFVVLGSFLSSLSLKVKVAQSCPILCDSSLRLHGVYHPWNSPGQNVGVGSLSLLQGIFPTQGSKPGLLHCRWVLYLLSHQGSPRILECIAYPFFRGHSQPRNWTGVSCIAGGSFTSWATREAHTDIGVCEQHQC